MRHITLDPTLFVAGESGGVDEQVLHDIFNACKRSGATLATVALSVFPEDETHGFAGFRARLEGLGLSDIALLAPVAYYGLAFPQLSLFATEEFEDIEREIHSILYPSIHYAWNDYRRAHQVEEKAPARGSPWWNAKRDVQAMLMHIENEGDLFVTGADIFHREIKTRQLVALGARAILTPAEACDFIAA